MGVIDYRWLQTLYLGLVLETTACHVEELYSKVRLLLNSCFYCSALQLVHLVEHYIYPLQRSGFSTCSAMWDDCGHQIGQGCFSCASDTYMGYLHQHR